MNIRYAILFPKPRLQRHGLRSLAKCRRLMSVHRLPCGCFHPAMQIEARCEDASTQDSRIETMRVNQSSFCGGRWGVRFVEGLIGGCASLASPLPLASDSEITRSQPQPLGAGFGTYRAFNRASSSAQQNGAAEDKRAAMLDDGFELARHRHSAHFASLGKAAKILRFVSKKTTSPFDLVLGMFGSIVPVRGMGLLPV